MNPLERLIASLVIIFASIACGWIFRRLCEWRYLPLDAARQDRLRHFVQAASIYILLPLAAMLSLWGLPQPEPGLLGLPLLGLAGYIAGGGLALGAARVLELSRVQTGSFFCCGTFTNIGAIGSLICLLYLGENSIALAALYRLLEEVYYFGVAFPVAQWFGHPEGAVSRRFRISPALYVIVAALLAGICMNLWKIHRPEFCTPLASASLLIATISFLFAIGLTLRFSRLTGYMRPAFAMSLIKFFCVPAIVIPLAALCGYGQDEGALPLRAVAILCSMPVAMTALVPPAMFRLDVDLANACWLVTTAGLILVLPLLMLVLPFL